MIIENVELTGSLEISGSFIVPLGGDSDRESSPITGSLFYNTASRRLETYNGNEWVTQSAGSGGSEEEGGYTPGTFTASPLNYLIVAGGGGGGSRFYGGGGGGGGFRSSSIASTNSSIASGSTFTITVGGGGASSPSSGDGGNGGNSSIAATGLTTITSCGGGGGGGSTTGGANQADGNDGGSGGGARTWSGVQLHGQGTTGQGHRGGVVNTTHADLGYTFSNSQYSPANAWGSGGGGAGQTGGNGHYQNVQHTRPGSGGDGSGSMITGTNTIYAGGGGGGWNANNADHSNCLTPYDSTNGVAPGGDGGGGNGGKGFTTPYSTATAGSTNTGGGGGAGSHSGATTGAAGGSGVVIVSYDSGSMGGAGGIKGDDGNGNRYHTFNSSDSFVLGNNDDFDIVTSNLEVHYDAGDFSSRSSSTEWNDISGNSRNATLVNGPTLGQNWYYDFDGSNDHGDFTPSITAAPLSYEVWFNPDVINSYQYIVRFGQQSDAATPGGILSLSINNANSTLYSYNGENLNAWESNILTVGTWHHAVVSVTDTTASRYLNGSLSGTTTLSAAVSMANEAAIAEYFSQYYFNGKIGQIRIYSKALSAAEVLQNYNATKTNFV